MKRLSLIAAACLLALTSCSESQQIENTAEVPEQLKPIGRANPVSTDATAESEVVELPPPLSPKARAFVESVENDPTGFFFSVCFWDQTGMSQGIAFVTQAPQRQNTGAMIIIGKEEALAITRYFARSSMLDKTDVMPAGMLSPGWSVHLGTENVSAYWYLGRQENALLKSTEVMGVRNMLGDKSRKRWDEFIRHVRESEFQSIDTIEREKQ